MVQIRYNQTTNSIESMVQIRYNQTTNSIESMVQIRAQLDKPSNQYHRKHGAD